MCLSFIPPGKRKFKPKRSGPAKGRAQAPRRSKKKKAPTKTKVEKQQMTLLECLGIDTSKHPELIEAIEASGDPLIDKPDSDVRFAFQNINGISIREGLELMPETATIGELQLDVTGFTETNVTWTKANVEKLESQLYTHLGYNQVVCSSNDDGIVEEGYQPGGSMLALVGPQSGRIVKRGSDPWGRFSWTTLRGGRDEGILVISAYRVSQTRGTTSGPFTAYSQQLDRMIKEGDFSLDPRTRLLTDLRELITTKRAEGYRPVLMMDANDELLDKGGTSFRNFVEELQLVDPLHEKFQQDGITTTTYARGTRRIDYILVDSTIVPAIKRIGTLGLHEGVISDHVMLYMDCDEKLLFQGVINRPVMTQSREFVIEHADKAMTFLERFHELAEEKKFHERVMTLAEDFRRHGATAHTLAQFQHLDTEIMECLLSAAKSVAKKKFGYQRSRDLGEAGMRLHLWNAVVSSKRLGMPLAALNLTQAETLGVSLETIESTSKTQAKKRVRESRAALWDVQKQANQKRIDWLEKNAQDIARAAGEIDWKKKMTEMAKLARQRGVNRKMTAAIRGARSNLDYIEVPRFEWFYSPLNGELYRYNDGVFEAYAAFTSQFALKPTDPTKFFAHHHLKAIPDDAVHAEIEHREGFIYRVKTYEPCNIWREVHDPKEIERTILKRNRRHLQQASIEPGRIHDPIMQQLIENYGSNDLVDDIREGRIPVEAAADEAIQALLSALHQTASKMTLPKIGGAISVARFQAAFRRVNEKTTSSPSGLHYSIWKIVAQDDKLAVWLSVMMSLPFMYGFVNERWTREVDVMLEKKRGVRRIHQLRIIGILEGDFQTALKILFAQQLMQAAEATGLSDEQWGSRNTRTATDAALRKMMTFEYGRYMKATIALFANDQTACFDRMIPELSNVIAGTFGMDVNVLRCRGKTIEQMKRRCKTGLGVSKDSYYNKDSEPRIQGEIQGKADVPSLWAMTSSLLLDAHKSVYTGLALPGVDGKGGIYKNNDGYVDDVDSYSGTLEYGHDAAVDTMYRMNDGAQKWSNIMDVSAAATAFDKCVTQILSHKEKKGSLVIDYDFQFDVVLKDKMGARTTIKYQPPDRPNVGLGYCIALDGNQRHEFDHRLKKIANMCRAAVSMHLSQSEAWTMFTLRLTPQTVYGMRLSQFSTKQCHSLDVKVLRTFLPILKINRSSPRAMVHGPLQLGGMEIDSHWALQAQWGLHYIVQTLRWNKQTAVDVRTTLAAFQMFSGFVSLVLMVPEIVIDYAPDGLMPHLRRLLASIDGQMSVADAWRPRIQRLHDESLMEVIASCDAVKPRERRLANETRIWLQITCTSELADANGVKIEWDRLRGKWQAKPEDHLRWPNQPKPTDEHWAAFRRCLRHTVCTNVSPYHRGDYKLDHQLGPWFIRQRQIKYDCYVSPKGIFWRDEYATYNCTPTSTTNFWQINYDEIVSLPSDSHPITARGVSEGRIWIWRHYRIHAPLRTSNPNNILASSFTENAGVRVDLVSDCSVHVKGRRSAGAWHLLSRDSGHRHVVRPLEHQAQSHSYRGELETFYYALKDADTILEYPHEITQHMDCESGLTSIDKPITNPRQTMRTDMDLVMAYKKLRAESKHTVTTKWVRGHADDKEDDPENITPMEWENIECDREANQCVDDGTSAPKFAPLPGYKAMLRIGANWITTNFRENVRFAASAQAQEEYIMDRLGISRRTLMSINQGTIGRVRRSHTIARRVRTSKMMFRWLPVGHNWKQCKLKSDKCPCCGERDETFEHLLKCENEELVSVRASAMSMIHSEMTTLKVPTNFTTVFTTAIKSVFTGDDLPSTQSEALADALESQGRIGWYNMVVGFLSSKWEEALSSFGVAEAPAMMDQILSLVWDHLCEQVWEVRNNILHTKSNHVSATEMQTMEDNLLWYLRHQTEVLDYRHRFLASYNVEDVGRWSRATRRARLASLDNARNYYENQLSQRSKSQSTIEDWLDSYIRLRSGRLILRKPPPLRDIYYKTLAAVSEDEEEFEFDE